MVEDARIDHKGWYVDDAYHDTIRGIVVALPHGRFIAGYLASSNDERVYYSEIFDSARDAARMADEHARVIAESESEHNAQFRAAANLEDDTETALQRLRECVSLRHVACMDYVRDEIGELIETIRGNRDRLSTEFKGIL